MENTQPALICPSCGSSIPDASFKFCSNCGVSLSGLHSIGFGRQFYIYFVSIFLPPFGLIWTFKFLRSSNPQHKIVALAAAILTIGSTFVTVWLTMGFIHTVQQQLNSFQSVGL